MRHYGTERSPRSVNDAAHDPEGGERHPQHHPKGKARARATVRLPMDILFLIFMECDVWTLVTCRLVCRRFDTFIKEQKGLLYKLALAFERQVDSPCQVFTPYINVASSSLTTNDHEDNPSSSPSAPLTSHQKLQRLRRQGLAWRSDLPPALKLSLPVTRSDSIYELNGGVFALGDVNGMETNSSWGNMNIVREGTRLDFVRLPSVIKGDLVPEWGCINVGKGFSIVDFTMDLDMDLLVLIEQKPAYGSTPNRPSPYRLHFLSLSRSVIALESHPLAYAPLLEYPCHPDWWEYQLMFGMYGDHIGLLLGSCQQPALCYDRIVIWDWKKGGMAALHANNEAFDTFLFLDEGLLLVPNVMTSTLDLVSYKLSETRRTFDATDVSPNPNLGSFTTLMAFKMPALQPGLGYTYILARSQPTGVSEQGARSTSQVTISTRSRVHSERLNDNLDEDSQEKPLRNPFSSNPTPFSPSIDDSIIAVSTRVGDITNDGNLEDTDNMRNDADGTLIVTRKMFRSWMKKEGAIKKDGEWCLESHSAILEGGSPSNDAHHASEPVLHLPLHRSTGVQTTPEVLPRNLSASTSFDSPMVASSAKVIPWHKWMRQTRWLMDMGSPRWVRDVCGMRVAARVKTPSRPAFPDANPTTLGSLHPGPQGTLGPLPSMHQFFTNAPSSFLALLPASSVSGTNTLLGPLVPLVPVMPVASLPSIATLFAPMPMFTPPPSLVSSEALSMPYRTRIFDFNVLPHIRQQGAIPYPTSMKLDLTIEGQPRRTSLEDDGSQEIERYYGDHAIDQGWSVFKDGLEWSRRPVWDDTIIKPGPTYAEEIRTSLPYLEITSRQFNDCTALMMDAERIIGMRTDHLGNLTSLEVLVI